MSDPRTRNQVTYEWVAEPIDEHGDIIDPLFGPTLADVKQQADGYPCEYVEFALVCRIGNEANGEQERDYAYIKRNGTLPAWFPEMDRQVPMRYLKEAAGE